MKIFNLESKANLVLWSLLLGIIILFSVSFYLSGNNAYCIDGPCGFKFGWPISFAEIYSQEVGDYPLSDYSNLIPKDTPHSETTFNDTSVTFIKVSSADLYGQHFESLNIQRYYFFTFLINWALWSIATVVLILGYKKYIKFNANALLVLVILHSLFAILALAILANQFLYSAFPFAPSLLFILVYVAPLLISPAIISSKISWKSKLISSLIFPISAIIIFFLTFYNSLSSLSPINALFILYLFLIYFAPIALYFARGRRVESLS